MANDGDAYAANVTDYCMYMNGGRDVTVGHSQSENNWACFASKLYSPDPVYPSVGGGTPDAFYKVYGEGDPDFLPAVTMTEYQY